MTSNLNLNIFPNPINKTLNFSKRVDNVIIYNLLGIIETEQQYVRQLSLENLKQGIYIAHIKINNSEVIKQIIKK